MSVELTRMIKKWVPSLVGLGGIALLGRMLGFLRDTTMAAKFGVSEQTDSYLTSYIIMDILIAANSAILVGTLTYLGKTKTQLISKENFNKFKLKVLVFISLVSLFLIVLLHYTIGNLQVFSPQSKYVLQISGTLMLASAPFIIVAAIFSAVYQLNGFMLMPGKLSVFVNIFAIISMSFLSERLGIISIPFGLFTGGLLFYLYQRFHPKLKTYFTKDGNSEILIRNWFISVFFIFLNSFLLNIVGLIERLFAFRLTEGAFSYYSYAIRIFLFPLSVLGYSISTSLLPLQVEAKSINNIEAMNGVLKKGIVTSTILAGFCFLIFASMSEQIVSFVYLRGQLTHHDSEIISNLLIILSFGVFPYLISPVVTNVYFATGRTKYLTINGVLIILLQICLLFISSLFIHDGRALAYSSMIVAFISLGNIVLFLWRKKLFTISQEIILKLSSLVATVLFGGIFIKYLIKIINIPLKSDLALLLFIVIVSLLISFFYYLFITYIFKIQIKSIIKDIFKSKKND